MQPLGYDIDCNIDRCARARARSDVTRWRFFREQFGFERSLNCTLAVNVNPILLMWLVSRNWDFQVNLSDCKYNYETRWEGGRERGSNSLPYTIRDCANY